MGGCPTARLNINLRQALSSSSDSFTLIFGSECHAPSGEAFHCRTEEKPDQLRPRADLDGGGAFAKLRTNQLFSLAIIVNAEQNASASKCLRRRGRKRRLGSRAETALTHAGSSSRRAILEQTDSSNPRPRSCNAPTKKATPNGIKRACGKRVPSVCQSIGDKFAEVGFRNGPNGKTLLR